MGVFRWGQKVCVRNAFVLLCPFILLGLLVTQHCDPPLSHYRVETYLSHLRFLGIAGYRAIPPPFGGIAKLCRGGGVRGAWGGIACSSVPSAL